MLISNYKSDWNAYWQSGISTSCISHNNDGYPKAIKSFWINEFIPFINNTNHLLDLCSGGGGIPKLILKSLDNSEMELILTSSDYTNIENEPIHNNKITLNFVNNCNCENLPFNKHSFNFVTSSYGIEYSKVSRTINEIDKVLKPQGIFAAVIHTQKSELVKNAQNQMLQSDFILNSSHYFESFKKVFLSKRQSKAFQNSAEKKYKECLNGIKLKMATQTNPIVLNSLLEISQDLYFHGKKNTPTQAVEQINLIEKSFLQNYNRMKNLLKIVDDEVNITRTINKFKAKGYKVILDKAIEENFKFFGHAIICQK